MVEIPHTCSQCFHVKGKGVRLWAQLRRYKRQGHIVWDKMKLDDGMTLAVVSKHQFPAKVIT